MPTRRGHGEGSISQRKDGRWEARIDLGYEGGRRQRKSIFSHSRAEVVEGLRQAMRARDRGMVMVGRQQTVAQFLEAWLRDVAKPKVRPSTYERYEEIARLHLVPDLGRIPLTKLRPQDVEGLLIRKVAAGMSAGSAQIVRTVLGTALNQAMRWSLVERNVAGLVTGPKVQRAATAFLTGEQARQLLDAAKVSPDARRLSALYVVALSLGLRMGELCGLRWEDVDFEHRDSKGGPQPVLSVNHGLQRIEGKLQLVPLKTDRSRRTLTMPSLVVQALTDHRQLQRRERLATGPAWHDSGHVFTAPTGTPLDPDTLRASFKRLLAVADLPPMRFHDLRHSAASLLLAQGVPMRMIMDTLGHSQIGITMNLYAHIAPEMRQEVADAADRALGGAG